MQITSLVRCLEKTIQVSMPLFIFYNALPIPEAAHRLVSCMHEAAQSTLYIDKRLGEVLADEIRKADDNYESN